MHAGRCQLARVGACPTLAPGCPAPDRRRGAHRPSARAHSGANAAARSGLGNVSGIGNLLVDAWIRCAPTPRESNARRGLDYVNLSASHFIANLLLVSTR